MTERSIESFSEENTTTYAVAPILVLPKFIRTPAGTQPSVHRRDERKDP